MKCDVVLIYRRNVTLSFYLNFLFVTIRGNIPVSVIRRKIKKH